MILEKEINTKLQYLIAMRETNFEEVLQTFNLRTLKS
jgi:hypothetical protein